MADPRLGVFSIYGRKIAVDVSTLPRDLRLHLRLRLLAIIPINSGRRLNQFYPLSIDV